MDNTQSGPACDFLVLWLQTAFLPFASDLDLHCLLRQGILFSKKKVNGSMLSSKSIMESYGIIVCSITSKPVKILWNLYNSKSKGPGNFIWIIKTSNNVTRVSVKTLKSLSIIENFELLAFELIRFCLVKYIIGQFAVNKNPKAVLLIKGVLFFC